MAQQTAVEWLIKRLVIEEDGKYHVELPYGNIDVTPIIEQAKQMEKEQMIELTQTLTSTPSDISRDMATFIVENFINNLNEISNK